MNSCYQDLHQGKFLSEPMIMCLITMIPITEYRVPPRDVQTTQIQTISGPRTFFTLSQENTNKYNNFTHQLTLVTSKVSTTSYCHTCNIHCT